MTTLATIALLCQVSAVEPSNGKGWTTVKQIQNEQLKCQKEYIKCANDDKEARRRKEKTFLSTYKLTQCILNKTEK